MKARRAVLSLCALGAALSPCGVLTGTTIALSERERFPKPIDFAVDETHAYIVYAPYPSADLLARLDAKPDVRLGIYARATGAEVAKVNLLRLWEEPPEVGPMPFVKATSYREGVVVSVAAPMDGAELFVYVDRNGDVGARRRMENFRITTLTRHRNFVVAASPERVALFDEHLNLAHDWSGSDSLILAAATESDIVVLEGVPDRAKGSYAGTVRWLALRDALQERAAISLPIGFAVHPPPKVLIGPEGLVLVVHDGMADWRECRLDRGEGAFECGEPAWGSDLKALHGMFQSAVVTVAQSADGYAVTVPYGCAVWSRRYDRSHSIAAQQLAVPTGSWELGILHDLVVRDWGGTVFALTSAFVTRGWDGGDYRTVLREVSLAAASPVQPTAEIPGCPSWSDVEFTQAVTADEVRTCVENGADPNAVFNCGAWTRPLGMAARQGNAETVRALIAAGAKVNIQDEEGDTALHDAARHARSDRTIQALLDGGADAMLRDANGKLAWDYAQDNEALRDSTLVRQSLRPD